MTKEGQREEISNEELIGSLLANPNVSGDVYLTDGKTILPVYIHPDLRTVRTDAPYKLEEDEEFGAFVKRNLDKSFVPLGLTAYHMLQDVDLPFDSVVLRHFTNGANIKDTGFRLSIFETRWIEDKMPEGVGA